MAHKITTPLERELQRRILQLTIKLLERIHYPDVPWMLIQMLDMLRFIASEEVGTLVADAAIGEVGADVAIKVIQKEVLE